MRVGAPQCFSLVSARRTTKALPLDKAQSRKARGSRDKGRLSLRWHPTIVDGGPHGLATASLAGRARPGQFWPGDKVSQGTGRQARTSAGRVDSQAAGHWPASAGRVDGAKQRLPTALECRGEKNGRAPAVFTWGEPPQQSCSPSLKRARARTPSAPEVPAAASSSGVEHCSRMESGRAASRCGGLLLLLLGGLRSILKTLPLI